MKQIVILIGVIIAALILKDAYANLDAAYSGAAKNAIQQQILILTGIAHAVIGIGILLCFVHFAKNISELLNKIVSTFKFYQDRADTKIGYFIIKLKSLIFSK